MSSDLANLADSVVTMARMQGASVSRAGARRSRDVSVTWRDGRAETIAEAVTRRVDLEVFIDGRYVRADTNDLRPASLGAFVAECIAMARVLEQDALRTLPDPTRYGPCDAALDVRDAASDELAIADRVSAADELECAVRSSRGAGRLASVGVVVADATVEEARVASDGFVGAFAHTSFQKVATVTLRGPGRQRPEGTASAVARHWSDLPPSRALAREAMRRAHGALRARTMAGVRLPMVVDAAAAPRLVWPLLDALSGRAVQQGQSFLQGFLGRVMASPALTLTDDPLLRRGLGSRAYDDDGFRAEPLSVVHAGVLRGYYVDDYHARKLHMRATTGSPSNIVFAQGERNRRALLADLGDAILVTEFLGGDASSTTGELSLAIAGYRVRGGDVRESLTGMNVAVSQRDLWRDLVAVGDDPCVYCTARTPTLVFAPVRFVGA